MEIILFAVIRKDPRAAVNLIVGKKTQGKTTILMLLPSPTRNSNLK